MKKIYSISDIMEITGVSKRTLHYYDETGILVPEKNSENGYREYTQKDLIRLQQILFYKSAGLSIKEVAEILDKNDDVKRKKLEEYREKLNRKIEELEKTREQLNRFLEGTPMENLDLYEIPLSEQYQKEAEIRYGNTDSYKEYENRQKKMSETERKEQYKNMEENLNMVFTEFADVMDLEIESEEVEIAVENWKKVMLDVTNFTDEVLVGIAMGYEGDERFKKYFEKYGKENITEFIYKAVKYYLQDKKNQQ